MLMTGDCPDTCAHPPAVRRTPWTTRLSAARGRTSRTSRLWCTHTECAVSFCGTTSSSPGWRTARPSSATSISSAIRSRTASSGRDTDSTSACPSSGSGGRRDWLSRRQRRSWRRLQEHFCSESQQRLIRYQFTFHYFNFFLFLCSFVCVHVCVCVCVCGWMDGWMCMHYNV